MRIKHKGKFMEVPTFTARVQTSQHVADAGLDTNKFALLDSPIDVENDDIIDLADDISTSDVVENN